MSNQAEFVNKILGNLGEEHDREPSVFESLAPRIADAFDTEGSATDEDLRGIFQEMEVTDELKAKYPKLVLVSYDSYNAEFESDDEDEEDEEDDEDSEDGDDEAEDSDES